MTGFVVAAVVIGVLILGGALWPLWRRAPGRTAGLLIVLCVCGVLLYRLIGTPQALQPNATQAPATLDAAITQLKAELQRNPKVAEGWQLLGRALEAQGKPQDARDAFDHAVKLLPNDPIALVEAAQSRSLADPQRRLDDTAVSMLEHALQLQPDQQRARWFLGVAQLQRGQAAAAAATWEPLLAQVDPATANSLRDEINAARAQAGQPPLKAPTPAATPAGAGVTVDVSLDPAFASRNHLSGDTTVFVIARIPNGPPMPVAVQKHSLQELPLHIVLSDADSPMPTQKLSALKQVEVVARISTTGGVQRAAGDAESAPVDVQLPAKAPVKLVIGSGQP